MKNLEIKKEVWIWLIMLVPMMYLLFVWHSLPEIVPTHFGMDGKPNDWSHKSTLVYLVAGMLAGIYFLFLIIPSIDPKRKLDGMGNKYYMLKLLVMLSMSVISFFIVQSAISGHVGSNLFVIIGALFAFLGNYMQSVKPNYFIGFRTPWTLESEDIWRKTHRLGGRLYFIAGLLIMILSFIVKDNFNRVLLPVVIIASLIPVVYSFILFKQKPSGNN